MAEQTTQLVPRVPKMKAFNQAIATSQRCEKQIYNKD